MQNDGYEVLRFVSSRQGSPVGTDHVTGELLITRLQKEPQIDSRLLFRWLNSLHDALLLYQRSEGWRNYDYLCPYNTVIDPEQQIHLLDLDAQQNRAVRRIMQEKRVMQLFYRDGMKYQNSIKKDFYSLGRTVQYLMSRAQITPPLGRREEKAVRSFIERCLDQKTFMEIARPIRQYRGKP